jgi:hypothetical protein
VPTTKPCPQSRAVREINNLREHFVDNGGEENRIHLIMD